LASFGSFARSKEQRKEIFTPFADTKVEKKCYYKPMKKRAIISVSDKEGIVKLAKKLVDLGWEIISTGGTRKVLNKAGIKTVSVEKITGNPEAFSGRMKTISYEIASALLFDRLNPRHVEEAKALNIKPIDMVVSDLYPFTEVIKGEISEEEAIENIAPLIEVRSRRIGGANYQIPFPTNENRRFVLASRWIIEAAKARKGKSMAEKIAQEFLDAMEKQGTAIRKRDDVHRMAEANKAFAHFARY